MDTFKTYSDVPDSLEKGHPAIQGPLHSEACHACSVRTRRRCRSFKRYWVVFCVAALTWLVFSYGQRAFHRPQHAWHWAGDSVGYPPPGGGDVDQCVGGTNWTIHYDQPPWAPEYPHGAETAFSLPLDSDALYLVSRGVLQHGQVNIEQSSQVADTVDVRVRVAYYHDGMLELVTVCQTERADREHGVGIFTPRKAPHPGHFGPTHGPEFHVTITLPSGKEGPLSVKKLETKMPNYSQHVADLEESVVFGTISLTSANGRLSVQSVTSEIGHFSSLNGEIDGHFSARSSLNLHTLNGRIVPTVSLLHREHADPSSLAIYTANGRIDAEISLASEALIGGEFEVDVESKHGEIGLAFIDSPVDSVLRCHVETTVGSVEVELDSAFEGTYSLRNVLGSKVISQHDVEDPAGKGRRRVMSQNEARGRVDGELRWVESDGSDSGNEGHVVLKAVVSSVKLIV